MKKKYWLLSSRIKTPNSQTRVASKLQHFIKLPPGLQSKTAVLRRRLLKSVGLVLGLGTLCCSCGSGPRVVRTPVAAPAVELESISIQGPKRRVAVGLFIDKTGYGNNLFGRVDDLGTQARDILESHLVKTGQFVLVDRSHLGILIDEQAIVKDKQSPEVGKKFIGVDAVIFGAVTESGIKTTGTEQFLSKSKVQTAHCKVTARLVDPQTGVVFFSTFGEANAETEVAEVMGFGGRAGYDATLMDKALNAAIVKLLSNMLNELGKRPWKGRVLDVRDGRVIISGGSRIGLNVGDTLNIQKPGDQIRDPETGINYRLPGKKVAQVKIVSTFGDNELNEGSICEIQSGKDIQKGYFVLVAE